MSDSNNTSISKYQEAEQYDTSTTQIKHLTLHNCTTHLDTLHTRRMTTSQRRLHRHIEGLLGILVVLGTEEIVALLRAVVIIVGVVGVGKILIPRMHEGIHVSIGVALTLA